MRLRLVLLGFLFWALATGLLRLAGQRILSADHWVRIVLLFAASFGLMAILIRRVCIRARLDRDQWPIAAVSLLLPTLLLDPFSSAFFPVVFPNMAPEAAGVFGGWMIVCCAGGLVRSVVPR
jgi:uncharacterized membrane protein YoaK (UPF0700 family)